MSETIHPRSSNIVPNYESYVMLRLNEIAVSIHRGAISTALEQLKTLWATLPDEIKKRMQIEKLMIDTISDVAKQQEGLNVFQALCARNKAYYMLGQTHVLPILDKLGHELYLGGYLEKPNTRIDKDAFNKLEKELEHQMG
jgi:hypothetical protein